MTSLNNNKAHYTSFHCDQVTQVRLLTDISTHEIDINSCLILCQTAAK